MKIQGEIFEQLKAEMYKAITHSQFDTYSNCARHYRENGIGKDSAKRCRWDIMWAIPVIQREELFSRIYGELDANDDHIDTALKAITGIR